MTFIFFLNYIVIGLITIYCTDASAYAVEGDSRFRRTTELKMLLLAKKRFFSMLFATFDANYWRPYITRLSTVISSCGLCVDV